jgi:hypothetical protein
MAATAGILQHRLATTPPRQLLRLTDFWLNQRAFLTVIGGGVAVFAALSPYTYVSGTGTVLMSLVVQGLAVWGTIITAKGLAAVQVESAIVRVIESRGDEYLRDIKAGQRSHVDLDQLEQSILPPNPAVPAPAMIRLFQHICKEAKDRKFESSVSIMQPYREEPLEDIFQLQNLQKIALWLGILGTFVGLLIAIAKADLTGGNFIPVVETMFSGLKVAFSASVAGLEVAVILGLMVLVLRKAQDHYFKLMENAVVTMLSLARNSINKDEYLAEFGQIRTTVTALTDMVYAQTQETKDQTEEIRAGMTKLADARKSFDGFLASLGDAQRQFIEDIRNLYDTLSLKNLSENLQGSLEQAGSLMSDRIEHGTAQITNRLTDFNRSVDTLSNAMGVQAHETAATATRLASQINTATSENLAAVRGVVAKVQEMQARDSSSTYSAKSELQDLSRRIAALTSAIEHMEHLTPRSRSIREYLASIRW